MQQLPLDDEIEDGNKFHLKILHPLKDVKEKEIEDQNKLNRNMWSMMTFEVIPLQCHHRKDLNRLEFQRD